MSLSALASPLHHNYTPQGNRHCAPQTPSPLRTSRNANRMSPPVQGSVLKASPDAKTPSSSFVTPSSVASISSTSTSTSASALPFQFQTLSRSQSPHASLAKSNAAAKARRSSLFLDKVGQRRDDSRFERRGEQALRMDFVRERRAWEERLKRKALELEVDDAIMDEVDQDGDVPGASINDENAIPFLTEDQEIEELLSYLDSNRTQSSSVQMNQASAGEGSSARRPTLDTISDDEEYDQLFMEVMAGADDVSRPGTADREGWCDLHQGHDWSMDLS